MTLVSLPGISLERLVLETGEHFKEFLGGGNGGVSDVL
jgi:hypothetical protein